MISKLFAACLLLSVGACAYPDPGAPDGPGEGQIEITGVLTTEGVECPALRDQDGQLYTLAADTGRFEAGDAVTVRGSRAEMSFCQQGTTIDVASIEAAS